MSKPITITATVDAWLTSTTDTMDKLLSAKDSKEVVSRLGFSNWNMAKGTYPWVKVGTAEVTVTLLPRDEIVAVQTKVLQDELQKERADSQMRQNAILDRISKLQALEYVEAES
jgi:hypothetical protein